MEKVYRLKYKNKWMKVKRMLGTYVYDLFDNPEDVEPERLTKISSGRSLVAEDCNIPIDEIEIICVGELKSTNKPNKLRQILENI